MTESLSQFKQQAFPRFPRRVNGIAGGKVFPGPQISNLRL